MALRNKLVQSGQLSEGYNEEMKELHNKNAKIPSDIIETIGYPTIDQVGKEANEATWFVIQHSIGQPEFMKKSAELLKSAVNENKADPKSIAYLTDRIAVLEGKPQLYGTQFDWDEPKATRSLALAIQRSSQFMRRVSSASPPENRSKPPRTVSPYPTRKKSGSLR